ncbi:hypothetical protein LSAT2_026564, partial [Lamellibrachia satsuma]
AAGTQHLAVCGTYPEVKLLIVKMVFLLPNMTSCLQPCDTGIISTLKVHYRKRLMWHIVVEMDKARMVTDVLDAIGWLHLA